MATSSAEPDKLFRYSDVTLYLDGEVKAESGRLRVSLTHFESECREPTFRLGVSHYAGLLGSYGSECETIDSWVRRVGAGFQAADSAGFRSLVWEFIKEQTWRLPLKVIPSLPLFLDLIDELPDWLKDVLGQEQPVPKFVPSDSGLRESGEDTEAGEAVLPGTDTVAPSKPFSDFKLTAPFPTYTGGGLNGKLHTGIDIKPKPYDAGKSYPVHPIGPGRVIRVDTQYLKDEVTGDFVLDAYGKKQLAGYGHYINVEHELSDGNKVYSRYAHLAEASTQKEGDIVGVDSELGNMGETGFATGPHLHLEVCLEEDFPNHWYYKHKPDEVYKEEPLVTYGEQMQKEYVNPLPIINGDSDWMFKTPVPAESQG